MAQPFRAAALALSTVLAGICVPTAQAQCVGPGPGGQIPAAVGSGGFWPLVMPEFPAQSGQWVEVPAGVSNITHVSIQGLSHAAIGDVQLVLHSPAGLAYNLFQPFGSADAESCRDDFTGTLDIVDAQRFDPCGTGLGVPGIACGFGPFLGAHAQSFGAWPDGMNGIFNTRLEDIPIETGSWMLSIYDWQPWTDSGTFASWELCFGAPSSPTPGHAPFQVVPGGTGQAFPSAGPDGTWPTRMPGGAVVSSRYVQVPAGASRLRAVRVDGLNHDVASECQLVLTVPTGERINLFQSFETASLAGSSNRFLGDYTFVDPLTGHDECGNLGWLFGTINFGYELPGTYQQRFGAWPQGACGISNRALSSLPAVSGVYTLTVYDWNHAQDGGSFASWSLCFDDVVGPATYCPQPLAGSSHGCVGQISASGQPNIAHTSSCVITVSAIEGARAGILFYGVSGRVGQPWCSGAPNYLCVRQPLCRVMQGSTGGAAGTCEGTLMLDWNTRVSSWSGALGAPFDAGDIVHVQGWFRDPPSCKKSGLTDAIELTYAP
jgi:subtilisin-like proprotein convertase family protein